MAPDDRAKRPANALAGPYGHPLHPLLVTVPIGAWVASLVFDIAATLSDEPAALAEGAYWLIGIGVIGALVAAIWGLMDLFVIPRGTPAFRTGVTHLLINVTVVILFAISFLIRRADGYETEPSVGLIVLSIVALLLLSVSGWLGGRMTYRFGVRVAADDAQRDGFEGRRHTGGDRIRRVA